MTVRLATPVLHAGPDTDPRNGLARGSAEWLHLSCGLCCGLGTVWGDWNPSGETCPSCEGDGLANATTARIREAQRLNARCL